MQPGTTEPILPAMPAGPSAGSPPAAEPSLGLLNTAASIMDFFNRSLRTMSGSLCKAREAGPSSSQEADDESKVSDCDFSLCKKYAWAVLACQQTLAMGTLSGSPGPGNGYFETLQLCFEQMEVTARKFGRFQEEARDSYVPFLERMFPCMHRLTRCLYPAILYFIALRLEEGKDYQNPENMDPDYWSLSTSPSQELRSAGSALLSRCHLMLHVLRTGKEEHFFDALPDFEQAWKSFCKTLLRESKERSYTFCPDISIQVLMSSLSEDRNYRQKVKAAHRIAGYFEDCPKRIIQAVSVYPSHLPDLYENNRAHAIAHLVREISLTTPVLFGGIFIKDATILKLP